MCEFREDGCLGLSSVPVVPLIFRRRYIRAKSGYTQQDPVDIRSQMSVFCQNFHFTSLIVSRCSQAHVGTTHLIMAAELLQATGGTMEQMEQHMRQVRQVSDVQMSSSSTSSTFTSSMGSTKLRKVSQGLSRTAEGRIHPPRSSPHLPYLFNYET